MQKELAWAIAEELVSRGFATVVSQERGSYELKLEQDTLDEKEFRLLKTLSNDFRLSISVYRDGVYVRSNLREKHVIKKDKPE